MSESPYSVDKLTFAIGYSIIFLFVLIAVIFPANFTAMMEVVQTFLLNNTGWLTVFLSVCIVVFTLCIIASPIGSIRIGGRHAKPDFSLWRWFAISLCAGIGIGILFWGIGEPIYHLMQPPTENLGIAPGSHQAAVFAISQSIMHWSVAQYCLYSICGVTFAVMCFNNNRPLSIIDCFAVIVPSRYFELSRCVVHTICLFSLCFAVISSMGSLIMMVSSMLSHLTGLPRSFMMDTLICVAGTGLFVISAISGLRRGMSFLSQQTTRLFIFLMFFVFLVGPTSFILTMGTEVFGYTLSSFFHNSSLMSTKFMDNPWSNSWLVVYMAFFFGYAPPIGLFLARLGKGRTVRQFLLMNVWGFVQSHGLESTVVAVLQTFPLSGVLIFLFIICTMTSFATLADPMTTVLATLSTKGLSINEEAPRRLKAVWGITAGVMALLLISTTGLSGLRGMAVDSVLAAEPPLSGRRGSSSYSITWGRTRLAA